MKYLEQFFETIFMILVGCFVLFLICILAFIPLGTSKDDVINELCSKQQYDFCEVDKITYKLKDKSEGYIKAR